ncbi:hypothetical protein [Terrisporobacter mayombei]|uniref:DUF4386 domain-containing protein n=1 Tax=Terrisporobacter mayombei TaxID=1541 RepID=A0ABY9Q6G6_9FIRM|nr:hypothetical protein [Terrisporobacter mayombei]MCC3869085.1 hypothetical protein [Terrisporobacter mayombei]WMT82781.1 hypothetical protein TEMA_32730 [Terrisporobacter mayombei]
MRNNPYFNFIKKDATQMILILLLIAVVNQGLTAISNIYMALEPGFNRQIELYSQANIYSMTFCFMAGIMFILKNFSGAISIRGDRKNFLKALAVWAVIMSLSMIVFSTALEIGLKTLVEVITHRDVVLITDFPWAEVAGMEMKNLDITFIWIIKTIFSRFMNGLMLFSLGYMIGAIGYRLRKRTNILVFIVIPVVLIGYIINSALRMDKFIIDLGVVICNIIVYFVENSVLIILLNIICIGIFSFVGNKLLMKAPTKEYANDLI